MTSITSARIGACLFAISIATPALACSGCGCNLTSDWLSQGLVAQPGTKVTLRLDYVPQTQLYAGSSKVDRAAIALPSDREIEVRTRNYYANLSLDHAFNAKWAVNVQLPFLLRPHDTILEGTTDVTHSNTRGIGDLRITGRFQGFGGKGITGIQFGVKLPTGKFRQTFKTGPGATDPVDRGLQPGSGTFGALAGAYHFGHLAGKFDFLVQAEAELPLNNRDFYRPGISGTLSAGVNYTGWKGITPQLQVNLHAAEKDHGTNADRPNSGGTHLYIAPGVTAAVSSRVSAFAIVQVPVYRYVSGYQLVPPVTVSAGMTVSF